MGGIGINGGKEGGIYWNKWREGEREGLVLIKGGREVVIGINGGKEEGMDWY